MATDVTIGGDGELFADEDKVLELELLDADPEIEPAAAPVNMIGWAITFDVRAKDNSPDPALLTKTASSVGTFNSVRASNTQRARVTVTDDDMHQFKGSNLPENAKTYRHSWKRVDAGAETVLSRGDFAPEKATAP